MKKEYRKPVIFIESFQLNAAIAGSCSDDTNEKPINHYATTCGDGIGTESSWQFFSGDTCDIDLVGESGDGNDTPCYHGPILSEGTTFVWS